MKQPYQVPLLWPACAWVLGIFLARSEWIPWQYDFVLVLFLGIWIAVSWHRYFCLWLLIGLGWGGLFYLHDTWQIAYAEGWVGQEIGVVGDVESLHAQDRFVRLRLTHVLRDDAVKLHGKLDLYLWAQQESIQAGQRIHAVVKLHPPYSHQNPGGFDYEGYCFERHIALMGSIHGVPSVVSNEPTILQRFRHQIRQAMPEDLAARGVLQALLLADRSDIPITVQDAFAATGAAHLLAISGLHVGMVALWGGWIAFWLLTRREAWIVSFSVQRWMLLSGVFCAVAYASVAGWPLPTQRAALMLGAAALAWWLRAKYSAVNILLAALMLILCWDSAAIFSASLWLSFVATLALITSVGGGSYSRQRLMRYLHGLFMVSLVAGLATLPLIVTVFERLPVWSLLANMLLVPLYGLLILPLALLGEVSLLLGMDLFARDLLAWSGVCITWGNGLLIQLQQWPAGNIWVAHLSWQWSVMYGVGVLIAGKYGWIHRQSVAIWSMLVLLLVYVSIATAETVVKESYFTAWDVGQGAAATWVQPMKDGSSWVVVMDVPGRKGSVMNGGTTVASGLRALGLTHVDVLMLSHAQSDHAGGALRLLDSVNHVGEVWLADVPANHRYETMHQLVQRVEKRGGKVRWLKQGDHVQWGSTSVDILWPPKDFSPNNDNNSSLVCSIELASQQRFLMAGDMEKPVEKRLLSAHVLKPYDLVLMPHHGSRTSSSRAFVEAIQPRQAIAQTGWKNHFGFPKEDVVQRYRHVHSTVWDTANGALFWFPERKSESVIQFKADFGRKRHAALQWVDLFL